MSTERGKHASILFAERKILYSAIESFVRENNDYESSVPVNQALEEIGQSTDINSVFLVPLRHVIFSMDTALRWILFLSLAPAHAAEKGESALPKKFDAQEALGTIPSIYDLGIADVVWSHFCDDGDDGDE